MARHYVAHNLEIHNVQMNEMIRGRAAPVLLLSEVEGSEAGEAPMPTLPRRVHGHKDIGVMLEERNSVSEGDGSFSPAEVSLAGLVDEDEADDRGSQPLGCEHPIGEQTSRTNAV